MVFAGRPSDACHSCRKGRLRCDRGRPGCTQCSRKGIPCPGYRDLSQLAFRDETKAVARKVHQKKGGAPPPAYCSAVAEQPRPAALSVASRPNGEASSASVYAAPPPASWSRPPQIRSTLGQPSEPLALAYFMTAFVPASPFEYLPEVHRVTPCDSALAAAITASSFASLSLRLNNNELLDAARTNYAVALSRTNQALASPEDAILDNTLIAVLLLGLFEAVMHVGRRSPDSWTTHTMGSLSLMRLRGEKQFRTPLGRRLFMQATVNIRTSCNQRLVAVPPQLAELHERARPFFDTDDPNVRLGPVVDKVANLRASIGRDNPPPGRVQRAIEEALAIDAEAAALCDMLTNEWRFELRPPEEVPPTAYLGLVHRYHNLAAVRHWNALRIMRLYLNEAIWVVAGKLPLAADEPFADTNPVFEVAYLRATAEANTVAIATDVLASVLHFAEPDGRLSSLSARFVIWPLSTVATALLAPVDTRTWALERLREIGFESRMPQALEAAALRDHSDAVAEDWLHLAYVA